MGAEPYSDIDHPGLAVLSTVGRCATWHAEAWLGFTFRAMLSPRIDHASLTVFSTVGSDAPWNAESWECGT